MKSGARAPASKDITLETFLATIENKLFDVHRARHHPVSNLSKSEHKTLHQLRTSKDIVVRLQDKGSKFVILDRTDYIDKVESNFNDSSFDLLPSDPSSSYYQTVRDWGVKWVNKGEITQPFLDYIINPILDRIRDTPLMDRGGGQKSPHPLFNSTIWCLTTMKLGRKRA